MEVEDARRRFRTSLVARLATVRPDGTPHVVPVVFAAEDDVVYTVIDAKPKRTTQLQRLVNLRSQPRCALLVDHYDADWSRLWWVRADGEARVLDEPVPSHRGLELLAARYPAYTDARPTGPLIVVSVHRWTGWSAVS